MGKIWAIISRRVSAISYGESDFQTTDGKTVVALKGRTMIDPVALKVGVTLRELLVEKRYSLKEVSKGSGVPSSTLSEWLSNRTPRNPVQVRRVADFLGVSLHYLLFGEEDRKEPLTALLKEDVFNGTFEISIRRVRAAKGIQ